MPRKGPVKKRKIAGDPKYGNQTAAKFINSLMHGGKKSKAETIFYEAFDVIAEKSGKDPLEVFLAAMENIKPGIEVRPRRVGGATYQVPMEINVARRINYINSVIIPKTSSCSRSNCNSTLSFLLHPVHGSSPFMNFPNFISKSSIK